MSEVHIGRNIRAIRLLLGIKQEAFAQKLGVAQQNVSRLENSMKVSPSKLAAVAHVLGVPVESIKTFDEKFVLTKALAQEAEQLTPVEEILGYFRAEIAKRDQIIQQLRMELGRITSNNNKETVNKSVEV